MLNQFALEETIEMWGGEPESEPIGKPEPVEDEAADQATSFIHTGVFKTLGVLFALQLVAFYAVFRSDAETVFIILICAFYLAMYLGTPLVMLRAGKIKQVKDPGWSRFLDMPVKINTGIITGREALFQVCIVPAALAITVFGICIILAATG